MEHVLCPKHTKPCVLKTGIKPGASQGKSFYLCGQQPCDYVKQASVEAIFCPSHRETYVELQRIVQSQSSDEKRHYFRCSSRDPKESWCGYVPFKPRNPDALKDYNFQTKASKTNMSPSQKSKDIPKSREGERLTNQKEKEPSNQKHKETSSSKSTFEEIAASQTSSVTSHAVKACNSSLILTEDKHSSRDALELQNGSKRSPICLDDSLTDSPEKDPCKNGPQKQIVPQAKHLTAGQNDSFSSYRIRGNEAESSDDDNDDAEKDRIPNVHDGKHPVRIASSDSGDSDEEDSFPKMAASKSKDAAAGAVHQGSKVREEERSMSSLSERPEMGGRKDGSAVMVNDLTGTVNQLQISRQDGRPRPSLSDLQMKKENLVSCLEGRKKIIGTVNVSALPDGGAKLQKQMEDIISQIKAVEIDIGKAKAESRNVPPSERPVVKVEPQIVRVYPEAGGTVHVPQNQVRPEPQVRVLPNGQTIVIPAQRQTSLLTHAVQIPPHVLQQMYAANPQAMHLYGGRMTAARLRDVGSITKEAIEKLHKQLESRPDESMELEDPHGLTVPLMTHQRQALAWLTWRERQQPAGGILADDMGLGKTLTMIALVLKSKEAKKLGTDEQKDAWMNRSKELKKMDKSIVDSHATLVICPASLVYQWQKEIEKRCRKKLLKVELYHGPNREKNILKLASNDIVLTTYSIVSREAGVTKTDSSEKPVEDDPEQETDGSGDKNPSDKPNILRIAWERVILDEAHSIKNHKSLTCMSVCRLRTGFRWALTGTPIQNDLLDMYSLLRFLRCSPFDEFKVWKRHVDTGKAMGTTKLNTIVQSLLLRRTKDQTCKKGKPIVTLPTKSTEVIKLELTEDERKVYDKVFALTKSTVQDYVRRHENKESGLDYRTQAGAKLNPLTDLFSSEDLISGRPTATGGARSRSESGSGSGSQPGQSQTTTKSTGSQILVLMLRMRQCCSHLSLMKQHLEEETLETEGIELTLEEQMKGMDLDEESESDSIKPSTSPLFTMSATSTKLKVLMDKLLDIKQTSDSSQPIKSVIVSQWTKMLDIVAHHLEKLNIKYSVIRGNIPPKKRTELVDDFNTNPRGIEVMLVSLKAGGVGLNLIGGNHLFLLDNHWNPALEEQACDRIYRVGQTRDVFIHRFLCKDTIEEKIVELQKRKLTIAKNVLTGSGASSQKLTLQDMRMLFGV
ncbi:transcription termination factor 2-like [Gigantopelta aegis]|uniref:transcription termination factor 2-like n=1 Tax=Gigantopelta aegis TaxID=1735272 RepID=UPI001B88E32A|nr:transcription termination factor 2-like [Gigantopelta aegis]